MDKPLSPKLLAVLAFIADRAVAPTSGEIAVSLNLNLTTAQSRVKRLKQLGLIKSHQQNMGKIAFNMMAANYWDLTQRGHDYIDAILSANKSAA